jgi:flagellar hook-associated protein 1 FlgK
MSGLFAALQTASTALDVFARALGVDQSNIANASTPGYAALRATILPIGSTGTGGHNGDFIALSSSGDSLADALVQSASSQASYSQTRAQQLTPVNQLFDITGSSGILSAFQQFSTAFANLSVSPNDPTLGAAALTAAGSVATAFQTAAAGLDSQRNQLDAGIQTTVSKINQLTGQISQFNVQTTRNSQPDAVVDANLRNALDQLSSLVDITVTKAPDGSVSVLAAGQLPLVVGSQAYTLTADPANLPGSQLASSAGGNSPASFSGQLGALLDTRNGAISQLLGTNGSAGSLNTLAAGFANRVNSLLSSGATATGAAGVPIFIFDAGNPANAARTLSLDATVTPAQLGLATQGVSPQANGVANQLSALTGSNLAADQIAGLAPQDLFAAVASSIGQQLSDATDASTSDQANLTTVQSSRQQQSGVSLDQEAVTISAIERSYQASAKVVSIIDQLTSDTLNLIK